MGQPTPLLGPPSGRDLAILAPRSPARRRAKGSRKRASGRSDSTARSTATKRAVSDTLRIRAWSDGAEPDSERAELPSESGMPGPLCEAERWDFSFESAGGEIVYPLVLIRAELFPGDSARSRSGRSRRSSENQIGEKLAEPAPGYLKFQIARRTIQPAQIHKQRDFSPRFRRFRSKTDIAQHTRDMRGAFFLNSGNARSNTLVAASPCAQRRFPTRAGKISAMLDEARPTRRRLRSKHRIVEPRDLVAFPAVQHFR